MTETPDATITMRPFAASPNIEKLAEALAAAQGQMPAIEKDRMVDAGKFSYQYADLAQILAATRPVLAAQGLSVLQPASVESKGTVRIRTILLHTSGQWLSDVLSVPVTDATDNKQIGSAMSYGRRYSYCAMVGIQPEREDDDGQAAREKGTGRERKARQIETTTSEEFITDAHKARLLAILKEHKIPGVLFGERVKMLYGAEGWGQIRRKNYESIVALAQNWGAADGLEREPGEEG